MIERNSTDGALKQLIKLLFNQMPSKNYFLYHFLRFFTKKVFKMGVKKMKN